MDVAGEYGRGVLWGVGVDGGGANGLGVWRRTGRWESECC